MNPSVVFYLDHPEAKYPTQGTKYSAGFDLYSVHDCVLYPYSPALIDTGVIMAIPIGWCGQIWPRSSKSIRYCQDILAGLIDSDYRTKRVQVSLFNQSDRPWHIEKGERIAQIVFVPHISKSIIVSTKEALDPLGTRTGGFGSTGF